MRPTNKSMKRLSLYLFLILFTLQTPSQANDIRDFQIEGMSIGDSLLDYFSKSEIENAQNYDHYPSDMKYRIIDINLKNKFYDSIQFYYIPGDKKFIIQSLNGRKVHNNINDCYNQKQEVEEELSVKFKNAKINKQRKSKHLDDPTGKSTHTMTFFDFGKNKGRANVACYDMYPTKKRYIFIAVSIQLQQVSAWVDSNYGVK